MRHVPVYIGLRILEQPHVFLSQTWIVVPRQEAHLGAISTESRPTICAMHESSSRIMRINIHNYIAEKSRLPLILDGAY